MKGSELKKLLRNYGCTVIKQGSNHEKWFSPITRSVFIVPRHDSKEIASGTLNSIKKQAGI